MATEPMPTSKRPVSQDDGGLWMDAGSANSAEGIGRSKDTSSKEGSQEVLPPLTPPSDDMGNLDEMEDDVFILHPPCTVPSWPAEGSTSARKEPNIKVPDGADSTKDANENPKSLDGEHGETHSTAVQDKVTGTGREEQVSESKMEGSVDITVSTEIQNKTLGASSPVESHTNINASAETERKKERDEATKRGKEEEITELKVGSLDDKVASGETNYPPTTLTDENKSISTSSQAQPPSNMETTTPVNETDSSPSHTRRFGPPELCKHNLTTEGTTAEPETTNGEEARDVDVEEKVDHSSVDYGVTKKQWVGRESACNVDPQPQPSLSRGYPKDQVAGGASEQQCVQQVESGSLTVARDIQQGEQLLYRLQMVQQRQEVQQVSEEPPPSNQVVMETANQASGGSHEVERAECRGEEEESEGEGGRVAAGKERRQGESGVECAEEGREASAREESEAEGGVRSEDIRSSLPVRHSAQAAAVTMASDGSDDDSGVSDDFSPVSIQNVHSNKDPIEREIRQAAEMERSMRRFRGSPNSQENLDVVEIPFKTPVTLLSWPKPPSSKAEPPGQVADRQFSEKKMQKEINQDIQRELALVNLGKFPGVYSKGTVRQLRERKMLFEAFQQGVTEGPTRRRRPISSTPSVLGVRSHVYPSVLERTRSLEMLSCSKDNPSSETLLVGKGAKRKVIILEKDVTLVAPYSSQERYLRLYKSMDSLNLESMAPIEKAIEEVRRGEKKTGDVDKGSVIVRENPFFKLRASLTLEKYIREAREREEELRRQRCSLYGDVGAAGGRQSSTEDPDNPNLPRKRTLLSANAFTTEDSRRHSKGKLGLIWPPPPPKDGRTQDTKVYKAGGLKAPLWQRWEEGMVNGEQPREKD